MPVLGEEREVVLLSKKSCHLCEAAEKELRRVLGATVRLAVVDIDDDPKLRDKYWATVPVVRLGGKDVFDAGMMDTRGSWRGKLAAILA